MEKRLKFAIVGCGRIAQRHAAEAARIGELVAVCDILPERADLLADQYGAKAYYHLDGLLSEAEGIDIISICTPNGLHALQSIQSLKAGLHVLCEKPMAIAAGDARAMIAEAEKQERKLFVVKQNRFNPPVLFAKKMIADQQLGRLLSFEMNCFWNRPASYYKGNWKGTVSADGGILYTQFSHFIDILYWFLGDLANVTGMRANKLHSNCIEFEDTGIALLEMKDQVIGSLNYSINAFEKNMEGSFTIFGEKGTLKIGGQYLNELEYFRVDKQSFPVLPAGNPPNQYGLYEGSMSNHDKVYDAFADAINNPNTSLVSAVDTMKTVEIIERIYLASPLLK